MTGRYCVLHHCMLSFFYLGRWAGYPSIYCLIFYIDGAIMVPGLRYRLMASADNMYQITVACSGSCINGDMV